jgi:hypothetical protein
VFADPRARLARYGDVARHAAAVMAEDCLNNMKRVGQRVCVCVCACVCVCVYMCVFVA